MAPRFIRLAASGLLVSALFLCLALPACTTPPAQQSASTQSGVPDSVPSDPRAVVQRMGDYLKTLQSFTLNADISTDVVLELGAKVQYLSAAEITMRRPDRFRASVVGDNGSRDYYYDGKSFTMYGKLLNFYATVDAPPTLDELFGTLLDKYDLPLPLADLLYQSVHSTLLDSTTAGAVVGRSRVGGTVCDHVGFHQNDVDWQLWVEAGSTPLPRRLVITTLDEPSQPQYQAVLTWNLTPRIDEAMFAFAPPKDAGRIPLAAVDE